MKIAYFIHSLHLQGGTERVLALKTGYLAGCPGYQVHVVTSCMKGRKPAFAISGDVAVHDLGASDHLPFSGYRRRMRKIIEEIQPDICIAVGDDIMSALIACRADTVKISEFHFSHEKYHLKYGKNLPGRIYAGFRTRKLNRLAGRFDRFVVLTAEDCSDWSKYVSNACYIHNPETFIPGRTSPLERKRCIAVGRLSYQKRFEDAIAIWKDVSGKHPDWTLDIFGGGSEEAMLAGAISSYGLEGKVRLMGRSDDIAGEMADSSILLMTSRYEGFPMVLLEASETGLPMVSYNCPKGPSEVIENGKNGFLVDNGDIRAAGEAVCRLIEDEELRKEMGRNAKIMSSRFSLESTMEKWKELFESLV